MTFLAFGLVEAGGLFRMDFKDFGSYKYVTSDTGVTMNGSTLLWVWLKMGIAQLFWSLCECVSRINWHRFEIINMSLGVCFLCFVAQVGLAVPGRVLFPLSWRVSSMCCLVPVIQLGLALVYLVLCLPGVHCGDPVTSSQFLAIV